MLFSSTIARFGCAALGVVLVQACSDAAQDGHAPAEPHWETVWADDFDGDQLDETKWTREQSCWGGGNNERQCYTARPENVRVEDGKLKLVARPEAFEGPLYPAHYAQSGDQRGAQAYTSGKVVTHGLADWRYGRISARIKLPAGQGAWPAFWMMPTDSHYGDWPLSGEIDIMEAVNLETPCDECPGGVERQTSGALHFGDTAPANDFLYAKTGEALSLDPVNQWHVYSVEWAEGVIQWLVDGELFLRLDDNDWRTASSAAKGNPNAPFDKDFYLNINLAVGGNLPEGSNGAGFDAETFPAEMLVDWVRVEQCVGDEVAGRACLSKQKWEGTASGPPDDRAS